MGSGSVKSVELYPPREWYALKVGHGVDSYHSGYLSPDAMECPCCKSLPVIEQWSDDRDPDTDVRIIPAQKFVAICPKCELRADAVGTPEEVLQAWNDQIFTEDTWLVNCHPKYASEDGVNDLCNRIIRDAMKDTVAMVKRKHQLMENLNFPGLSDLYRLQYYDELKKTRRELEKMQEFFEESVFMVNLDTDGVLSDIRKAVYPDLTPEERIKIPLKLVKM